MLRKIRIIIAGLMLAGITLLFLDITGALHAWLGWIAKLQFFPAVMAVNLGAVALLLLLTLLFGRIYCSVICPLGIFQDILSRLGKKRRFGYKPERKWLRYGVLALFIAALVAGVQVFVAFIEPYSAYGRMVQNLLAPLWDWGNNLLAWISARAGAYAFWPKEVWLRSLPTLIVAVVTLVALAILAIKGGRAYCNNICPVGTMLSLVSRFSMFRPVIDTSKCKNCGSCARQCKASCINAKEHKIDYSRCVDCFDCIDDCKFGALRYRFAWGRKKASGTAEGDSGRRAFLTVSALAGGSLLAKAQEKKTDGGFAQILPTTRPQRKTPITPAGSFGPKHFYDTCTACQLCVAACPNNVLRPSSSLEHLMQPEMSYEKGYCRPECTKCANLCPAGAIFPLTPELKSAIHIGIASVDRSLCVVETSGASCGNCARHCPAGAIQMVRKDPDDEDSLMIPSVDESRCIGCGACENLCPARPLSAITVNGRSNHIID